MSLWREGVTGCRRAFLLAALLAAGASPVLSQDDVARIKRISLMTPDLERSIAFFTEVIGFTLDFTGELPADGEPFLGPVFGVDTSVPIRRALLSTSAEPRGLFLIEQKAMPRPEPASLRTAVTVVQVESVSAVRQRAEAFGSPMTDTVSDISPEGARFSEAMIESPGGHAVLVYEYAETGQQ
jgi:catechol 2,3-dioxygenase-like lactoylglutathione lyase family enzyme